MKEQITSRCPCFAMSATECNCEKVVKLPIENVVCPRCFHLHSDLDEWALKPHRIHHCENCGNLFEGTYKAVSDPSFTSEFPEDVQYIYSSRSAKKSSDYTQMVEAIQMAQNWLQIAYKLMESQEIAEKTVENEWPIHLGDALHYCGEALGELDPK
jgi:hypothetical protein